MKAEKKEVAPAMARTDISVVQAGFCVSVFFLLMLLFNGTAMMKSAKRLPYGQTRTFWMAVLRPVEQVSRVSRLDVVRVRAQETVGGWLNRSARAAGE